MKRKLFIFIWSALLQSWRRKEFIVLLLLQISVICPLFFVNFFDQSSPARLIVEVSLLLVWLISLFMTISVSQRSIADEIEFRTINPLLSKPISYFQLFLGKLLGTYAVIGIGLTMLYFATFCVDRFSGLDASVEFWFQAWFLHCLCLFVLATTVTTGSLFFSKSLNVSLSYILVVSSFFFSEKIFMFTQSAEGFSSLIGNVLITLIPHFELYDIRKLLIHGWEPLSFNVLALLTGYAMFYSAISFVLGCNRLKRLEF